MLHLKQFMLMYFGDGRNIYILMVFKMSSGRGEVIPSDELDTNEPIIRRKVHTRDGKESGIAIKSYGWASLWDGQPEHFTSYA